MGKGSKRRPEDVKAIDKNWDRAMNPEMWCPICGTGRESFHDICKACEDTFALAFPEEYKKGIDGFIKTYVVVNSGFENLLLQERARK